MMCTVHSLFHSYLYWLMVLVGKTPIYDAAFCNHADIVKILASLTDNPNAPIQNGNTPIQVAACNGHTEIVRILTPLTDYPNAPNKYGSTPIHTAAKGSTKLSLKDPSFFTMGLIE